MSASRWRTAAARSRRPSSRSPSGSPATRPLTRRTPAAALAARPAMTMFGRKRSGTARRSGRTRQREPGPSGGHRSPPAPTRRSTSVATPVGHAPHARPIAGVEALQSDARTDPGGALRPHRRHGGDQAAARGAQSPDPRADRRAGGRAAAVLARPRAGTAGRHDRRQHGRPRTARAAAARRNRSPTSWSTASRRSMSSVAASSSSPTSSFRDNQHVMNVAQRIVTRIGRRVDETCPICDARLEDGSRVNIIAPPLAIDGCSISIRKFAQEEHHARRHGAAGQHQRRRRSRAQDRRRPAGSTSSSPAAPARARRRCSTPCRS